MSWGVKLPHILKPISGSSLGGSGVFVGCSPTSGKNSANYDSRQK